LAGFTTTTLPAKTAAVLGIHGGSLQFASYGQAVEIYLKFNYSRAAFHQGAPPNAEISNLLLTCFFQMLKHLIKPWQSLHRPFQLQIVTRLRR
jgi:hypothetical protein